MTSDLAMKLLPDIMENLRDNVRNQQELNDAYARIISLILIEAENSISGRNMRRRTTKEYRTVHEMETDA